MEVKTFAEELFFTTVRIETLNLKSGLGSGTGFFYLHERNGKNYSFLVTNKHVVEDVIKGKITFFKKLNGKPTLGDVVSIDAMNFGNLWFGHENDKVDIAVLPFSSMEKQIKEKLGFDIFNRNIPASMLTTKEAFKIDIDALEELVFVGYPSGIWDSKNYLPIMRKGSTATPLYVDFEGEKKFLMDASVFPGSSGSPVFIYNKGVYAAKDNKPKVGNRMFFVGIIASVYQRTDLNEIIVKSVPTTNQPFAINKQMIDLGVVFKAELIPEAIEQFLSQPHINIED